MQTLLIELTSHCSLCSLTGCQLLYSALFVRLFLCCCCCAALLFPLLPPFLFFLHSSSLYCAFLSSSLPPADHWDALNSFLAVAGWDFIMDLNALKQWLAGTSSWISMHSRGMLMAHGIQAMLGSCCSIPLKGTTPLPALNWEMVCGLMCIFKECVIA